MVAPHSLTHLPAIPVFADLGGGAIPAGGAIQRPPLRLVQERPAVTVAVTPGATVEALVAANHADLPATRWANSLAPAAQPPAGSGLLIPPGPGAIVPVLPNERPSAFAGRLNIDPRLVLDYNALSRDEPRPAGTFLQVPVAGAPATSLLTSVVVPQSPGVPQVNPAQYYTGSGNSAGGRFPWGQCTWYLATKRLVPWNGNGGQWFANARGIRPEGQVPVAGAIAVINTSWVGHVAYVEKVNPDGSFVISEEHYPVLGGLDYRTVTTKSITLVGFIY